MDKFSSYFELIAAINFAFVLSTHFLKSITEKVSGQYQILISKLDHIKQLHEDNIKKLVERSKGLTEEANKIVAKLHNRSKEIENAIEQTRYYL